MAAVTGNPVIESKRRPRRLTRNLNISCGKACREFDAVTTSVS